MRSFISFQPGESRSCVGCHESRTAAPVQPERKSTAALTEAHDTLIPAPWGDRPINFLRDVQPVLNDHCVKCHAGLKPAGGLDFGAGLISYDDQVADYGHNRAFETILAKGLVSLSPARMQDASITPPLAYGSRKSKLITVLDDTLHAKEVRLSGDDRLRLCMWIDANAPYHDRFVNKRVSEPAYNMAGDQSLRAQLLQIHERRCASCHKPDDITRLDWIDVNNPRKSLFLDAPLSIQAGGRQACGGPVYADGQDDDYRQALGMVRDAVSKAWEYPRRDMTAIRRPREAKLETP